MHKRKASPKYLTGYSTRGTIGVSGKPTSQKTIEERYMRFAIKPTNDGKFVIVSGVLKTPISVYDSLEAAEMDLKWVVEEERIERRAERAFDRYEREHGDE